MFNEIANAVRKNNEQYEVSVFGKHAFYSKDATRQFHTVEVCDDHEYFRNPFAHDVDRIIHSHSYARYMDKTQVFFMIKNDHITRRSLHVQMVSRIARTIGRCLKLNEDLIEAIADRKSVV